MARITRKEFDKIVALAVACFNARDLGEDIRSLHKRALDKAYVAAYMKKFKESDGTAVNDKVTEAYNSAFGNSDNTVHVFRTEFIDRLTEDFELVKDPVFQVVTAIDEHIAELDSGWNPFKRSPDEKIDALIVLRSDLLKAHEEESTIGDVIRKWQKTGNQAIIAQPRTIFKGIEQTEKEQMETETGTTAFIARLLENYGNKPTLEEPQVKRTRLYKLYEPFTDYINSRTTWVQKLITFFFRNSELSAAKLEQAERVTKEVMDFKGSYSDLKDWLKTEKEAHAELSAQHGKNHFNLKEERKDKIEIPGVTRYETDVDVFTGSQGPTYVYRSSYWVNDVRREKEEIDGRSELAEAFHRAIKG